VEVIEGLLRCDNPTCQASFPIVDGIPILVSDPAQLLVNQPAGLLQSLRPETLAVLVQGASDDAPLQRVLEHLSIYLDAHWGDCADPKAGAPASPWGGEALFPAVRTAFAAAAPKNCVVELGCSVGRGLAMLRPSCGLGVGIDLHLPALRAARRLLRGEALPFARRSLGRHYQPATLQPAARSGGGEVVLICADALDPPLPPEIADGVVALNLLDSVSHPSQLLSVIDGLCSEGGEIFLTSPYSWQSSVVHEGARLGEPTGDAATALRTQLSTGAGLRARYELLSQSELPWELRRDARSLHRYLVDALHARKGRPHSYA
jgi:SAM-dependent methyltransferase